MTTADPDERADRLPPVTPGGVAAFLIAVCVAFVAPLIIDGGFGT